MKKLLIFLLIALIFGSISALSIREEWEKAKEACSKVKEFLQKYGIYDDVVNLLKQGSKAVAQKLCEKKLPSDVCTSIIIVVGKILSKINVC